MNLGEATSFMSRLTINFAILVYSIVNFCWGWELQSKPNVILIVVDDIGWDDVGFHGSTQVKTPNIDAFAAKGQILDSHYVSPLCSPSRASLLTGRYPIHMGLQHSVITQGQRLAVPLNESMLSEYLRPAGYATHAIGKWHLGYFAKEYTPTYRGFDSFYGYYNENMDYYDHTSSVDFTVRDSKNPAWGLDWHFDENGTLNFVDEFGQYSTDLITERAIKILSNYSSQEQPLFMYLAYQSIHSGNQDAPLQAPQEDVNEFPNIYDTRRRTTVGMIYNLDKSIGRLYDALEKEGYLENSIIAFMSDNGGPTLNCDFSWASNFPLRGSKHTLYEGGVRAAAFAHLPNMAGAGSVSNNLMHVSDWVPTVLEAAGVDIPDQLDGVTQLESLMNNTASQRKEVLLNIDQRTNISAIRMGDFKLLTGQWTDPYGGCEHNSGWYSPPGENPVSFYVNTQSTVKCADPPRLLFHKCKSKSLGMDACMYNIAEDPCEYKNIVDDDQYRSERDELLKRLEYFYESALEPRWPLPDLSSLPLYHNFTWGPWTNDTTIQT